ncbi:hypothetical protein CANCADRAFT_29217 [Tortispora caseinolytica NRRL Y-17796]|uniref:MPN domain-containing protein n=1 Tax=Tortispora caseinolytica NRRL Y-17796 TaxID=767744 RepID=A0A1E4TAW4_9ASCO|nr:hypothetical protein CANCADRAFT_29217 [Tortispora caseinolytica NRRL Y-17796]
MARENGIQKVKIDANVAFKIIKHTTESAPAGVSGQLLGLEDGDAIEISYAFAFPMGEDLASSWPSSEANKNYASTMTESLTAVNVVPNAAGFYISSFLGSNIYSAQTLDAFSMYQSDEMSSPVLIVHDPTRTAHTASLNLQAYVLSPAYDAVKKGHWFTRAAMAKHGLTFKDVLIPVPVEITNSHYANAFIHSYAETQTEPVNPALHGLDLNIDRYLCGNAEAMLDTLDDLTYDLGSFQYFLRHLNREEARIVQWQQRRKVENAQREARGQDPLPENDWKKIFRLPNEPSRLEGMLEAAHVERICDQIEQYSAGSVPKLYGIRALLQ